MNGKYFQIRFILSAPDQLLGAGFLDRIRLPLDLGVFTYDHNHFFTREADDCSVGEANILNTEHIVGTFFGSDRGCEAFAQQTEGQGVPQGCQGYPGIFGVEDIRSNFA